MTGELGMVHYSDRICSSQCKIRYTLIPVSLLRASISSRYFRVVGIYGMAFAFTASQGKGMKRIPYLRCANQSK